jgi:kynurenine formamidase
VTLTYNIGTKVNGLHHVGVGAMFYNGFTGPSIARTWGTTKLGNETTGPVVTRGVVIDVIGLKVAHGLTSAYFLAPNGEPVLRSNYRITIEDIEASLDNSNISEPIGPGDVALIRTGWRHLIEDAPEQYINGAPPGPYLRECRYLASSRPAIVGSDTWCFELQDPAVHNGAFSPCHQELSMKYGIRVAEAIPTDELVEDGAFEFVFCFCPQNARGAVTGSSPPIALGQPSAKSGAGPNCPPAPKHDNQAWLRS